MRKKLLAALLSACLMAGLAVPAFAADPVPDGDEGIQRAPIEGTVTYPVLPGGTFEELYGKLPEAPANRPKTRAATQNVYRADYYGSQLAQIYGNNYSTDGYNALTTTQQTPNANDTQVRYTTPIKATSQAVVNKYAKETLGGYVPYVADVPSFFWDNGSISLEGFSYYLGDTISEVKLLTGKWITENNDYNSVQAVADDVAALNTEISDILSGIPANASDYQKLAYFNEELTTRILYDDALANGLSSSRRGYNATGALLDGSAVCDGYAKAFKMLCDAENIPCLRISGTGVTPGGGGNHAWNYVQLGGSWYAVDTTWNDPSVEDADGNLVDNSAYRWDYFLVGSNSKDFMGVNFIDSHLPNVLEDNNGQMVTDPYQVPTLSKTAYKPAANEATTYQISTSKIGTGSILPENPQVVEYQSQKITMQAPAGSFVYAYQADTDTYFPWTYADGMSTSHTFANVEGNHSLVADFRTVEGNKKINVTSKVLSGIGTIEAGTFVPEGVDIGAFRVIPGSGYEVDSISVVAIVNEAEVAPDGYTFTGTPYYGYDAIGDTTIEVSFKKIGGQPDLPSYTSPVYTASDDTTVQLTIPVANGNLDAAISLAPLSGTPESELALNRAGERDILTAYDISLTDSEGNPVHTLEKAITVDLEGLNLEAGSRYSVIGVHEDGKVTTHSATVRKLSTGRLTFQSSEFSVFYVVKGDFSAPSSSYSSGGGGNGFTKYSITATAGEGGTISPAGETRVDALTDITYTVTPNAGYVVDKVKIDGTKEVSLTGNTYTFKAVDEPYTIHVTFKKSGAATVPDTSVQQPVIANPATGDSNPGLLLLSALLAVSASVLVLGRKKLFAGK